MTDLKAKPSVTDMGSLWIRVVQTLGVGTAFGALMVAMTW